MPCIPTSTVRMWAAIVILGALGSAFGSVSRDGLPSDWQSKVAGFDAFFANDDSGALINDGYPKGIYLPLLGNGYLSHAKGVRSDVMYISGVFNNETTSPSHRAKIPASFAVTVENSDPLGILMDVREGTYLRRGSFSASQAWYELRWYAHRSLRNLYVLELDVHNDGKQAFSVSISNAVSSFESEDFVFQTPTNLQDSSSSASSICGKTTIPETTGGPTHTLCVTADAVPQSIAVSAEQTLVKHTFVASYATSLDLSSFDIDVILAKSQQDYRHGRNLASQGSLHESHVQGWDALWSRGIEIAGRPDVAIAVNSSLYAILSSVRDDWPYGLAPGGLTNYYNGHSFWDTETWMYPPMLLLQPEIARSLVQYRFNRLDGARQKALSYSPPWAGTMFPWESAYSGVETCPSWAATGSREDHISGDIALALWQYWLATQDRTWLEQTALPMLQGIAEFWESRSVVDAAGVAHIRDIIPPDEYVDHVHDSVYSNFVAAQALRFYVRTVDILGQTATCSKCSAYSALADNLVILFDTTLGIHPEYEGYPGNTVKQADVVLLHYPLEMAMNETVQRADLDYYSARTDVHGPAMTWGMHAIGYLDLDDAATAASFFNRSFQDNMHEPLQVWTETPDGNAVNFITGAGGFLQTLLNGYAGLRLSAETGLTMMPRCPEGATSLKLRGVHYLAEAYDLEYECDEGRVSSQVSIAQQKKGQSQTLRTEKTRVGHRVPVRV